MFKFKYDLPKFLLLIFLFAVSIYDLFIEGNFFEASVVSKIRNLVLLLAIFVAAILYSFRDKEEEPR